MTFTVEAIPPDVCAALRERDDAGQPPRVRVDDEGGAPLRCCLRESRPGERIALASYAPLRRWAAGVAAADPGPYDEVGPVYLHAQPCPGPAHGGVPAMSGTRRQVARAYSADGHIQDGEVVDPGGDLDAALDRLFADPRFAVVHIRNVVAGCFMYEARRR